MRNLKEVKTTARMLSRIPEKKEFDCYLFRKTEAGGFISEGVLFHNFTDKKKKTEAVFPKNWNFVYFYKSGKTYALGTDEPGAKREKKLKKVMKKEKKAVVSEKNRLAEIVKGLSSVIGKKASLPILEAVKIVSDGKMISFTGTDLDKVLIEKLSGDFGKFSCVVPFDKFQKVVSKTKGKAVFSLEKDVLSIGADGNRFKIDIDGDVADYPTFSLAGKKSKLVVKDEKAFYAVMKTAAKLTTAHNVNKSYSGVLLSPGKNGKFDVVSTDIHRLLVVTTDLYSVKNQIVVSADAIDIMAKINPENKKAEHTIIVASDSLPKLVVEFGDTFFCTRLLMPEFPKYETVMVKGKQSVEFTADRKELKEKMGLVAGFYARSELAPVKLFADSKTMKIVNPNVETAIAIKTKAKPSAEPFSVSARYVSDFIGNFEEEEISVKTDKSLKPIQFTGTIEGQKAVYLVMPLRV